MIAVHDEDLVRPTVADRAVGEWYPCALVMRIVIHHLLLLEMRWFGCRKVARLAREEFDHELVRVELLRVLNDRVVASAHPLDLILRETESGNVIPGIGHLALADDIPVVGWCRRSYCHELGCVRREVALLVARDHERFGRGELTDCGHVLGRDHRTGRGQIGIDLPCVGDCCATERS